MKNPTENVSETVVSTVAENEIREEDFKGGIIVQGEYSGGRIIHHGFDSNDIRQDYVNYAYKLGGWDFVYMIECENGNRNPNSKVRDRVGYAYGLCQLNYKYQRYILDNTDYKTNRARQVEECYTKYQNGTPFYGRNRIINGKKCYEYVKSRFTLVE